MGNASINPVGPLLAVLFSAFPRGTSTEKQLLYLQQIEAKNFDPLDIGEAIQRMIHSLDRLPENPLPTILGFIHDSECDRLKETGDDARYSPQEGRDLAISRLKRQERPITEPEIDAELARMACHGLRTEGVDIETAADVCGYRR